MVRPSKDIKSYVEEASGIHSEREPRLADLNARLEIAIVSEEYMDRKTKSQLDNTNAIIARKKKYIKLNQE